LIQCGVDHRYEEHGGGHDWPYWEKHIRQSLLFFNEIERGSNKG